MPEIVDFNTAHIAASAMSCIFLWPRKYTAEQLHDQMNQGHLNGSPEAFAGALGVLAAREWIVTSSDDRPATFTHTKAFEGRAVEMRMHMTTLPIQTQQQYDNAVNACRNLMNRPEGSKKRAQVKFLGEVAELGKQYDLEKSGKKWFPAELGWEVLAVVDANPDKLLF